MLRRRCTKEIGLVEGGRERSSIVRREGLRIVSKGLLRVGRRRPTGCYLVSSQRKEKTVEDNGPSEMWPIARAAPGRHRDQEFFEHVARQLE